MPNEKTPIHSGHRARMRSRFFETGLDGFQPHEILEMLLFCVIPKRDVNPLAHALLDKFGTLDAVLSAPVDELLQVPGVGNQTCEFFASLSSMLQSYVGNCYLEPKNIKNLAAALKYVPESARKSTKRGLTVIFADRFNRPLSVRSYPGRPNDPAVIRAILSKALSLHSHSAIIFCTGYRSAQLFSKQEMNTFHPLVNALAGVDSFTVDCVLLSQSHILSLRAENLLTGHATEQQGNLSRWDQWLGPVASDVSEDRWHPLSLLEDPLLPDGCLPPSPEAPL